MIGKRHKVKKAGDERLLKVVAQLQRQLAEQKVFDQTTICLLYTSPSPRDCS